VIIVENINHGEEIPGAADIAVDLKEPTSNKMIRY
jgi:hypothetical protein